MKKLIKDINPTEEPKETSPKMVFLGSISSISMLLLLWLFLFG